MEGKAEEIRHKSSGKKASGCETVPKSPDPKRQILPAFATYKQSGAIKRYFGITSIEIKNLGDKK